MVTSPPWLRCFRVLCSTTTQSVSTLTWSASCTISRTGTLAYPQFVHGVLGKHAAVDVRGAKQDRRSQRAVQDRNEEVSWKQTGMLFIACS